MRVCRRETRGHATLWKRSLLLIRRRQAAVPGGPSCPTRSAGPIPKVEKPSATSMSSPSPQLVRPYRARVESEARTPPSQDNAETQDSHLETSLGVLCEDKLQTVGQRLNLAVPCTRQTQLASEKPALRRACWEGASRWCKSSVVVAKVRRGPGASKQVESAEAGLSPTSTLRRE